MRDKQLKRLGLSYDWDREVATCLEEYYRWNQWFFIKMYERGLAYKKRLVCELVPVVQYGACERAGGGRPLLALQHGGDAQGTGAVVLQDHGLCRRASCPHCDKLTGWPERVLTMQRNWIGKSTGVEVDFTVEGTGEKLAIFTTRQDTLFGVTFMSIAPEHPMLESLIKGKKQADEVRAFCQRVMSEDKASAHRRENRKKKASSPAPTAINPLNNEKVPVWVGNFVLMEYGTGAIMSVPAHDQRDFEFAKKYGLPHPGRDPEP